MFRLCFLQKTRYCCSLVQYPRLFSLFKPQPCFNRCFLQYLPQKKCWCKIIKAKNVLECSVAPRAPGVPRLTQTSSSDIVLNDTFLELPPESMLGCLCITPRTRMMLWSLVHFPLQPDQVVQSLTSCTNIRDTDKLWLWSTWVWPGHDSQNAAATPNSIIWPVPLAAEHRSWTALRKPAKRKINLAGPKFSPCKQTCTLILISCYSTLIIRDLPLCRAD